MYHVNMLNTKFIKINIAEQPGLAVEKPGQCVEQPGPPFFKEVQMQFYYGKYWFEMYAKISY